MHCWLRVAATLFALVRPFRHRGRSPCLPSVSTDVDQVRRAGNLDVSLPRRTRTGLLPIRPRTCADRGRWRHRGRASSSHLRTRNRPSSGTRMVVKSRPPPRPVAATASGRPTAATPSGAFTYPGTAHRRKARTRPGPRCCHEPDPAGSPVPDHINRQIASGRSTFTDSPHTRESPSTT